VVKTTQRSPPGCLSPEAVPPKSNKARTPNPSSASHPTGAEAFAAAAWPERARSGSINRENSGSCGLASRASNGECQVHYPRRSNHDSYHRFVIRTVVRVQLIRYESGLHYGDNRQKCRDCDGRHVRGSRRNRPRTARTTAHERPYTEDGGEDSADSKMPRVVGLWAHGESIDRSRRGGRDHKTRRNAP
jgi:hypothetical protein